jgi:two-component system sensor histidine kinase VicK
MIWIQHLHVQPSRIASISVGGLLIAIAIVGLVGLAINERVKHVTEYALEYDIEVEDRGDDFRVAVLDMRHYQRNILFTGPSRRGIANFEGAYLRLQQQIDQLGRVGAVYPRVIQNDRLRRVAAAYYSDFRPVIDLYHSDPGAFATASDDGLVRLAELERVARDIDHFGEERAAASLQAVEEATGTARLVLLSVLGGLGLLGIGLAYSTVSGVRQQQRMAQQLSDALRVKSDFVADASHELRTPLTVLRANAEVALEIDRASAQAEFLEEIVRESERMTHLVEDMLLLTRSDSDSLPLQMEAVDLEPFLAELAQRARMLAGERGASLDAELMATGRSELDRARIEQVALILVDNAAEYGASGGPITLAASEARTGEFVIEVRDRGPGIPEADLPFIFERFYRADKARARRQSGAGLGLTIARAIIEAHDGRIEAMNRPGGGMIMRFWLPKRAGGRRVEVTPLGATR